MPPRPLRPKDERALLVVEEKVQESQGNKRRVVSSACIPCRKRKSSEYETIGVPPANKLVATRRQPEPTLSCIRPTFFTIRTKLTGYRCTSTKILVSFEQVSDLLLGSRRGKPLNEFQNATVQFQRVRPARLFTVQHASTMQIAIIGGKSL